MQGGLLHRSHSILIVFNPTPVEASVAKSSTMSGQLNIYIYNNNNNNNEFV